MLDLVRYNKYSRKDVHDIFSPDTLFTPQAGTWGMTGIVKIPGSISDYVFFVTYGQSQGEHNFDEGIDENGILSWQSQPHMGFQSADIRNLISHNSNESNIYLFLRTSKKDLYTYLGLLEYVEHDLERERPIFFKWKIIDWNSEQALASLGNLVMNPPQRSFPISSNSFTWLTRKVLVKEMDKSVFVHHGTHIPLEVLDFWGDQLENNQNKTVEVYFQNKLYEMKLEKDNHSRTRLFWKTAFTTILRNMFSEAYAAFAAGVAVTDVPIIRFKKLGEDKYTIDLTDEAKNKIPSETDQLEIIPDAVTEGKLLKYTGIRYERNPKNRKSAIALHGLTCFGCGFNFGAAYGEFGEGFIEIHHTKPLYSNETEVLVNPQTDLIPLCSNCHRMVHHSKTRILTIDELKRLLKKQHK